MQQQDGFFGGADGQGIFWQSWSPQRPRAALLLVHGLAEHSGRYTALASYFVERGIAVYALDHPGHGRSAGPRAHIRRFRQFTDTLSDFLDLVCQQQPQLPVFLLGHSMGGLIGSTFLLDNQARLSGAILSGPAVGMPDSVTPLIMAVGKVLSALAPRLGVVQLDAEGISRDPAVVQAYLADPLVYKGKPSARLGAQMLEAMERLAAHAGEIRLPVLIVQGGADRLVDPAGAQRLHDALGSSDKALRLYPQLYHEVFNEPERQGVLEEVSSWLECRLPD